MALPVSHCLGAEVSVSGINGFGRPRGLQQHPGFLWSAELPDHRAECPGRSCAFIGEGAAEGGDIEVDGSGEGANGSEDIHQVPVFEEETLLG